jgi:hypothetical protein
VATLIAAAQPGLASAREYDGSVTITDSGFWHESVSYGPHVQWSSAILDYSWHGTETFKVYELHKGVPEFDPVGNGPALGMPTVTGEMKYVGSLTNPGIAENCSAQITEKPEGDDFGWFGAGALNGLISIGAQHPTASTLLADGTGSCSSPALSSSIPEDVLDKFDETTETHGTLKLPALGFAGKPFVEHQADSGTAPNLNEHGEGSTTTSWENTVTAYAGGTAPPSTPAPPKLSEAQAQGKQKALESLEVVKTQAAYPCIVAGVGSAMAGLGYATSVVGGGLPAGVAGTVMVAASGKLCLYYLQLTKSLAAIIDDPPLPGAQLPARAATPRVKPLALPPCGAAGKASCEGIERALQGLNRALAVTAPVARAAAISIGRLTAAREHHRKAAISLQSRDLKALSRRLRADAKVVGSRQRALAAALKAAGVQLSVPSQQLTAAAGAYSAALRRAGISAAQLRRVHVSPEPSTAPWPG